MIFRPLRRMAALACLSACGCSAMRELPRDQYASVPERRAVTVETRSGERHEFERVHAGTDSLVGWERRDVEGSFDELQSVPLSFDEVARMSVRSVDWYKTGLVGGLALAAALAVVLTAPGRTTGSAGENGPCGPRPCP